MKTTKLISTAILSLGLFSAASMAAYPEQPIQIIVPYGGAGTADQIARRFAKSISETLGTTVLVVSRPGGNTIIGTDLVAKDKPDGYKVLMVTSTNIVLNPLLYKELPYDVDKDLKVISINVDVPMVIIANSKMPFSTITELQQYGQKNVGVLNYSSASATGPLALTMERLKSEMNFKAELIAYPGAAPALTAVLSGDVQVGMDAFSGPLALIKAGRVKALAVTSTERLKVMPLIPTVAETKAGFKASIWYGFAVHANTPSEITDKLKAAIDRAALDNEKILAEQGLLVFQSMNRKQIDQFIADDKESFGKIIKERGIKL